MQIPRYIKNRRVRLGRQRATEPPRQFNETRVFVLQDGRLAIVSGTSRVFEAWCVRNVGWFDLSDVFELHKLRVRLSDSPSVVASLVRMYEAEGFEVAYPRKSGGLVAWNADSGEVLGKGSAKQLKPVLKCDGRRFYRVQVTGVPIVLGKRVIEVTPVDLFGAI